MTILRVLAMCYLKSDMVILQFKNSAFALEFAHSVVHVCKAGDFPLRVCAKTSKTWFFG